MGTTKPGEGATAFIGLGANLGDARATLRAALDALRALAEPGSFAASSLYVSAPVDSSGPDYVNAVARLRTGLAPHALLDALQAIEQGFGRERPYRNAPRTLDLDVLLFDVQGEEGGSVVVEVFRDVDRHLFARCEAEFGAEAVQVRDTVAIDGQLNDVATLA